MADLEDAGIKGFGGGRFQDPRPNGLAATGGSGDALVETTQRS